MIDRSTGNFAQMLRSPDLRFSDIRSDVVRGPIPFSYPIDARNRAVLVHLLKGNLRLEIDDADLPSFDVTQGSTVGFEVGRAHCWVAASHAAAGLAPGDCIELFISTIPRNMGVVQQNKNGFIHVPADAQPFAEMFKLSIAMQMTELEDPARGNDDAIIRRAAEINMITFVRYVRARLVEQPDVPERLQHDEYLLRAWTAFFTDPQRRWTARDLAQAAGLGRSAFRDRFTRAFGAPLLQTLTMLKLQQAEAMLKQNQTPLIEIAFTVGYHSEAAFVRAFHRQYGMPPGKYRSMHAEASIAAAQPDKQGSGTGQQ